jgi:hypothetical protein
MDENTALLRVPSQDITITLVGRFNPVSGLIVMLEAMCFKYPKDHNQTLWFPSLTLNKSGKSVSCATWLDDDKPWAKLILETIQINPDLQEHIFARGL